MLTALGADPERAFSFAVVMHLLVFVPPLAIALAVMLRFGSQALLHRDRVEGRVAPAGADNTPTERPRSSDS